MNASRDEASGGFTAEEKAAIKDRAKELRASETKVDQERDMLAKIAELSNDDRDTAERLHAAITAEVPALSPKLYYGMPAYAKDGKIVCFFQPAQKFKTRYATFGFNDSAKLDDGTIWPTSYAITTLSDDVLKTIVRLVKKAVS